MKKTTFEDITKINHYILLLVYHSGFENRNGLRIAPHEQAIQTLKSFKMVESITFPLKGSPYFYQYVKPTVSQVDLDDTKHASKVLKKI